MNLKDVEELIGLAKKNDLSELCYKNKEGFEVKVKLTHSLAYENVMPSAKVTAPKSIEKEKVSDSNLKEITSPFVGTFYRSSSPESGPYVKEGQKIGQGQALCIVEAMKIMNEIESDFSGEIVEICAENETYVEFGQVLFKIRV